MKTINIVTVNSGWILQKIAERISLNNKEENIEIKVSNECDLNSDVNYYCDIQNCYFGQKTKLDIGYFTHADRNSKDWLINFFNDRQCFSNLDGIVSMNQRYTDMLIEVGYKKEKIETIVPGETYEKFPLKKVKLGIVSRGGYEGYGQFFIEQLLETYHFKNYDLCFLGNGWNNIENLASRKGISLKVLPDNNYDIYPAFYKHIDYLLIPTLWTAGPMSMQEALSTGLPIIASDVGFVNYEFMADYVYKPNDINGLINILEKIQQPIFSRRKQVENMRWSEYTKKIVKFINKIQREKHYE